MKQSQWFDEELKIASYDKELLYDTNTYEKFITNCNSTMSYESFKRMIRKYLMKALQKEKEEIQTNEKNINYSDIFKSITEFISQHKRKLSNEDLELIAKSYDLELSDILKIADLKKVIDAAYKLEMLHLEDKIEINKIKDELNIIKLENKNLIRSQISIDNVINVLEEIIIEYEPFSPPIFKISDTSNKPSIEGVVQLSDWHVDERVFLEQMHGLNEYSIQIAKDRIDAIFEKIIQNCSKFNLSTINLLFLGDLISGNLHDLAEHNEVGIIKSIILLADYTSQHIQNLSQHVKIKVIGLCGNHSRLEKKPYFKFKQINNFEYILYEFMKRSTVKIVEDFIIPDSAFLVHKILGTNMFSFHGDIINGGSGLNSIPGNLSRDISLLDGTLSKVLDDIDVVNMGHFHTPNYSHSFSGAQIIMNGSLIGGNEFSINAIKKSHPPCQVFYIVEEKSKTIRYLDFLEV